MTNRPTCCQFCHGWQLPAADSMHAEIASVLEGAALRVKLLALFAYVLRHSPRLLSSGPSLFPTLCDIIVVF